MDEMQVFKNEEFGQVRTASIGGEPRFCLADICKALDIGNPTDVKNRLCPNGVDNIEVIDSMGRRQNAIFISEQNLYKAIFQSRKPSAERFTDWVTGEVLPAIRKTGRYEIQRQAGIREVIDLIRVTRQTMADQGIAPREIALAVEDIGKQYGIGFPEFFVRPESATMSDVYGMVDFVYAHKDGREKPTYDGFAIARSGVKKIGG